MNTLSKPCHMIVLFTDFGLDGPYIGQLLTVLYREAPSVRVVNLQADAPPGDPLSSAYLLASYATGFPPESIFLCVVDPGVGSPRLPLVVRVDGMWFIAPDNGLLELVMRRAAVVDPFIITWQPPCLGASFHARDLFAPIAARLAHGHHVPVKGISKIDIIRNDCPDDLPAIIYIDRFGNGITGLRTTAVDPKAILSCGAYHLRWARTFSEVPIGSSFWYENANGLVEIAVNQGRAVDRLELKIGSRVVVNPPLGC